MTSAALCSAIRTCNKREKVDINIRLAKYIHYARHRLMDGLTDGRADRREMGEGRREIDRDV